MTKEEYCDGGNEYNMSMVFPKKGAIKGFTKAIKSNHINTLSAEELQPINEKIR